MRILPIILALAALLLPTLPIPTRPSSAHPSSARPAPGPTHPASGPTTRPASDPTGPASTHPATDPAHPLSFAAAYRDTATRMLATGCPYATWAAQGRRFLAFDPAGDGRGVEVLGDLATASRVAILIPGVDTVLADFDRGLGGVPRRAPGVQARALHAQLAKRAAGVAVIAWLGYDPPEGVGLAAATEGRARAGARDLTGFVRDLRRQRPGVTVTLIGHSYGALVAGLAARNLPEVHDVITLGAPGIGVDRAADLGGATVWSALAPTDWIRRIPQVRLLGLGLGRRPSAAGFGSITLPVDGVAGHDYYLTEGSATLRAVTDVVLSGGPRHAGPGRVS